VAADQQPRKADEPAWYTDEQLAEIEAKRKAHAAA
jgi:hypothetical protein